MWHYWLRPKISNFVSSDQITNSSNHSADSKPLANAQRAFFYVFFSRGFCFRQAVREIIVGSNFLWSVRMCTSTCYSYLDFRSIETSHVILGIPCAKIFLGRADLASVDEVGINFLPFKQCIRQRNGIYQTAFFLGVIFDIFNFQNNLYSISIKLLSITTCSRYKNGSGCDDLIYTHTPTFLLWKP